ncbi:hypothetical protein LCGC14_0389380 [marine sediment metagenome]|uniref:UvrD-like helicase C-terminal domain-containing protein n=1 Tax=marine sediment metagenome TaxID=412755 RepID=A0A0F9VM02_9ZZZZ
MAHTLGETITLYPEQQAAKELALSWFENPDSDPVFRVFGYAGTGKTTVIKEFVEEIKGKILYAAFTGKAALVMRRHGVPASTIHSLIYKPIIPEEEYFKEVKENFQLAREAGNREASKELSDEMRKCSALSFELNDESPLNSAALLVLDECSMVNDEMLQDLLTFDVPILVLGDPGQLPPIHGTGALIAARPDVMFTEIHRQALDNPIIKLSFLARQGKPIPRGQYGRSSHIALADLSKQQALDFDQILTGKNATRRNWNRRMRGILEYKGSYPNPGEKLICLKNKKSLGLFNGLLVTVKEILEEYDRFIEMTVATELGTDVCVRTHRAHFDEYAKPGLVKSLQWWDFQDSEEFDFGYAITVHKSQGSQWENSGFYDDKFLNWKQEERSKWLYTGLTRAVETVTLMS